MSPADWPPIIQAIAGGVVLIIGAVASAIVLIITSRAEQAAAIRAVQATADRAAADAAAVRTTTTTTNSGTHLLDKIDALAMASVRIEAEQARQATEQKRQADQQTATASDIRGIRRDIGRLQDTDQADRVRAEEAHRDIWAAIRHWLPHKQQ